MFRDIHHILLCETELVEVKVCQKGKGNGCSVCSVLLSPAKEAIKQHWAFSGDKCGFLEWQSGGASDLRTRSACGCTCCRAPLLKLNGT